MNTHNTMTKETHTNLETSRLMNEVLSVETGMWWYDKHNSRGIIRESEKKNKMPVFSFYPAHTFATAVQWLEEYGRQEAIPRRSVIKSWRTEKQHMLLNAFVAGNYDMSSPEVSEFIRGVVKG